LLSLIPAIFAYSFYDSHSVTNAVDNAPDQQTPTQHLPSSRDHATTVVATSRYSNGNHSSHRRAVTPMLRAIDYIRRLQRLEAFRVPWCQLHVLLKCPFLLRIQAGPHPNLHAKRQLGRFMRFARFTVLPNRQTTPRL